MSFRDLAPDWPDIPLIDPTHVADILDLFVNMQARMDGALLIMICDELRRPLQPIQIDEFEQMPLPDAYRVFPQMDESFARMAPGCSLLFALARRGGLTVTPADRRWRRCVEDTFQRMPLIGFHIVTPDGSRIVHDVDAAA